MSFLFLDFETKSTVDLKKCGADVYARHPSTDILCMGFAVDDGEVQLWRPGTNHHTASMYAAGHTIVAHNTAFELAIWNNVGVKKYGWRELRASETLDTMAMAYAMALPGALADAAPGAGLTVQKDEVGHRIMLQVSQPRKEIENGCLFCDVPDPACVHCYGSGSFYDWYTPSSHPDKFEALYAYCKQDIEVERQLFKRLMRLSASEQSLWNLDHAINQRGVKIDLPAVRKAIQIVEAEKERLNARMKEATDGAVQTCTATGQLTSWLSFKLEREISGVAKADIVGLLNDATLPTDVRSVCLLRQEAAKSSTAKLTKMLNTVCSDGRVRSMFQFLGAGATGRWAGRGLGQNFPRPTIPQQSIEEVFKILERVT